MPVVLSIVVPAIAIVIPVVIVLTAAMIAVPIACEVPVAIVSRGDPAGARIRRLRPVALMPLVMVPNRKPVALHPEVIRARTWRPYGDDSRRRRRADANPDRDLTEPEARCERK